MQLPSRTGTPQIAVLIPCLNEESTIGKVVRDFRTQLPDADIYVFDNDSSDRTAQVAEKAGAIVIKEYRRGKGCVVQAMFRKVEADVYVLVDGDDTYPAEAVKEMILLIVQGRADMVVGSRLARASKSEFKSVNRFGNRFFLLILNSFFRTNLTDLLSGYRVMSRGFVKNVPLLAGGFEIETELTIQALEKGFKIIEVPINLKHRPEGSESKIKILQDGIRILATIFLLFRDYKPFTFFGSVGVLLLIPAMFLGAIVTSDYLKTGLVPRFPSAILAVGLVLSALLSFTIGLILSTMSRRFRELERQLHMLSKEVTTAHNFGNRPG
ncbi:MAG: glycosyltransferase [Desulfobacterales bacterium]|nr:glycosyltransferase [Desulfobacterales bacterium]